MLGTYASAAFVCVGALLLGQAVLRLCGATRWSWLSAPVGLAAMILIAIPALHVPGRATAIALVLGVVLLAGLLHMVRNPAHRPPGLGLVAGVPVALLTAVPFVSAGHAGTLGWSFDNDMAAHLLLADAYRSGLVERLNPLLPDYPLGPHALSAVVAQGLGVGVDEAFAGVTIAGAVLLGWTALAALRRPRRWAPLVVVPLVGMPFLVAAYYGQGSFKELLEATLVLGFALLLALPPQLARLRRWIPAALLLAGTLSVYSFLGAVWPLGFLGAWLAGIAVGRLRVGGSVRSLAAAARAGLPPGGVGAAALLVAVGPQIPRLAAFISNRTGTNGTGIGRNDLGNLARPLPIWEAFGSWGNPDFRLPAPDHLTNRLWVAFAVGLVALGAVWAIRRREWMLVAALGLAIAIWAVSARSQSPYVAAKGLVILSPLAMLVAVRALVESDEHRDRPRSRWRWRVAPLLAVVLLARVVDSSWGALRVSQVGPTDHLRELRSLQPLLGHRPTLFLGNDDFVRWELDETPVTAPVIGFQLLPIRAQKRWSYGMDYDVDSLDSTTLNRFAWVIAPRDAAASAPPPQLRPVRRTRNFILYRRTGTIRPQGILAEGDAAAARLDCRTAQGRALVRAGGVATIRGAEVGVPAPPLAPGASATVVLPLPAGRWDLVMPAWGPRPIEVRAPDLRTTLPANLDRPGPRWPVGRIVVRRAERVAVTLRATRSRWTPASALTTPGAVIAVPVGSERTVPIAEACGRLVDHYEQAASG
jgi:hypothetical protein